MIKWREGKAGFVGASKRLIKGVFEYTYSITSAIIAPTPPDTEGMEWTLPSNLLHYTLPDNTLDYTLSDNRLHYTLKEEDG